MAGRRRTSGKIKDPPGCILCKRSTEDEIDFGGLFSTKTLHAHYFCLLLSENISQSGQDNQGIWGFLNSDITKEVQGSKKQQCHYCKEFGATLGCNRKNCKRKFHLPCGLMNRTQHDMDKFVSYCHSHRKPNNIPTKMKNKMNEHKCLICLESYNQRNINLDQLLWADCCKKDVILHIACIKKLALSAGYFTKCPACNNTQGFISTIKRFGVFVPERDASWELEGNAFSELLQRHSSCDAINCICPKGRNYKHGSGLWKIMLCLLCGSFGCHKRCSGTEEHFVCKTCNITRAARMEDSSNSSSTISAVTEPTHSNEASSPPLQDDEPAVIQQLNKDASDSESEIDIVCISSDSDDHFSEREPDSPQPSNKAPTYSMPSSSKKRKLTDRPVTVPQVARKKTVFAQNRNHRYVQQVARKSTTSNLIYSSPLPHKTEKSPEAPTSSSESAFKFSNLDLKTPKYENTPPTNIKPINHEFSVDNLAHNNSDTGDKNITSIKNIINSTLDLDQPSKNCFQFFCAGPLILQCSSDKAVEIDNSNEVEIVNMPEGVATQRNIPLIKSDINNIIVIDDSDDESSSNIKIAEVCSLSDSVADSKYNLNTNQRLSTSGIFENRIRQINRTFLKRTQSLHNFNYVKRMRKVVKIDFKPIDSKESQWCLPLIPR